MVSATDVRELTGGSETSQILRETPKTVCHNPSVNVVVELWSRVMNLQLMSLSGCQTELTAFLFVTVCCEYLDCSDL